MHSNAAKLRTNTFLGSRCAMETPNGVVMALPMAIENIAGKYTYPMLRAGRVVSSDPVVMYPMVPDSAMGKLIAAAVPMAVSSGTLQYSI